jgi:integrase
VAGNVARRPNGKWRARYRDPAAKEHAKHFDRKADAERWLAAAQNAIARGDWIDPAESRITVAEWSKVWTATKSHLKPKTRESYDSVLRIWVLPRWGRVPLIAVTHADVVTWAAQVREQVSAAQTRQALLILSQMLKLAVRDGRLARNVTEGISKPRVPPPEQRFLSYKEVRRLADECQPPYDLLVVLLAFTGLRFGEVAGLCIGDVDLVRARLAINWSLVEVAGGLHRDTPKSHRRRTVPIVPFLREPLAEYVTGRDREDPLFSSTKGGPLRNSNFRHYVFDPAVRRAGLLPLTPHDMRDTAASLAVASGASVKTVQRMLGHASAAVTLDIYTGLFDADLDDVADRMSEAAEETFGEWKMKRDNGDAGDKAIGDDTSGEETKKP